MSVLSDNAGAITYLTEGHGPVFSPSGDHIFHEHINYDEQSTELMMMGRDGSNPVNITRDVLGTEGMVTDIGGGYCYDRPQ